MVVVQDLTKNELKQRIEKLYDLLRDCSLCPRRCSVDRMDGEKGYCGMGKTLTISSYGPHFGEEKELVGVRGSGTIFLTGCNLHCLYCQNYDISNRYKGYEVDAKEFSKVMLGLQKMGCHNINFVTPTHFAPQIIEAVMLAREEGLSVPLVYNCGGYETVNTLKLLDGIIDIYMPDIKYSDAKSAKKFSGAPDYPEIVREALKEMHGQVGDLSMDSGGVATRGLLVRHLVLPNGLAGTGATMHFIANRISKHTYVNIMDQYRPCHKADEFPEIDRMVAAGEYNEAVDIARREGLRRGF